MLTNEFRRIGIALLLVATAGTGCNGQIGGTPNGSGGSNNSGSGGSNNPGSGGSNNGSGGSSRAAPAVRTAAPVARPARAAPR